MSWNDSDYTEAGAKLLLDSIGGSRLTITRAVSGTGVIAADTLSRQTDVTGKKHTLELFGMETTGEGDDSARLVKIRIKGAESSYVMHQIGLYGRPDGAVEDVLLMLMQDDYGVEIPSAASDQEFELVFNAAIAISREAKIALQMSADMRILKQFLRQEVHDTTAHAKIVEVTIPQSAWQPETPDAEYPYTAEIEMEGVTAEFYPSVTPRNEASIEVARKAEIAPYADTLEGTLQLWAKNLPEGDIAATVQLVAPKSQEKMEKIVFDGADVGLTIVDGRVCVTYYKKKGDA